MLVLTALLAGCDVLGGDTGLEGVEVEDLGTFTTDTGGLTGDISFDIGDDVSSVIVWCGPYGDNTLGTAWDVKNGSGSLYYTNEYHESYAEKPMRVGTLDDLLPVLMPVSPDADISSGTWSLDAWIATGGTPTDVECGAIYRTSEVGSSATVDLHFVSVGVGVDKDNADLQSVLATVGDLWSSAKLSVGEVTYEEFSGNTATYQVVDGDKEFNDLLRTASPGKGQVITVFLVEEITDDDGATILGLAGGPPGLATQHGTSKSGMVVTTADLGSDNDLIARIIAHEGAHFMGLFHTSEKTGETHDPLSDTPECGNSSDGNSDGTVSTSECAGKGAENLMWWAANDAATDLSSDQGWVLRRNPVAL